MSLIVTGLDHTGAINASWARCQQKHSLARDSKQPIMRLQSSEFVPRLEYLLDRTSGSHAIFKKLAESAARAGNCLVITDEKGILVHLDSIGTNHNAENWNGIALGSCWDERVAGTNGVSMALLERRLFTVRGQEHFFSKLEPFSCSAIPLLDGGNNIIGALSLCAIDRGNTADYLFAHQLLGAAADRIQRNLFEREFDDIEIISVSIPDHRYLFRSNELIAINDDGIIIGSTSKAYNLVGLTRPDDLKGQSFYSLFGADEGAMKTTEQRLSIKARNGPTLNLQTHVHRHKLYGLTHDHQKVPELATRPSSKRKKLAPALIEFATGSESLATICMRANEYFQRALPFLIEGASGTGKSGLVLALHQGMKLSADCVLTVDCAVMGEEKSDRGYFQTLIEQARAIDTLSGEAEKISTIVFDNVDELPAHAQAELRNLLSSIEVCRRETRHRLVSDLRIIAICQRPLSSLVNENYFRDDLYYLLANAVIRLPILRQREHPEILMQSLANKLANAQVEITKEAQQVLFAYHWPGNVRQLCSVLEQALIEGNGERISPLELSATPVVESPSNAQGASDQPSVSTFELQYDERTMLIDALQGANWNVSKAARNLAIGRATIHRKMKHYGIERPA